MPQPRTLSQKIWDSHLVHRGDGEPDLLCHARTVRRGKELTFTEITATDAGGAVVAHAVQVYRIV